MESGKWKIGKKYNVKEKTTTNMEPQEVTLTDGATPRRVVAKSRGSANHYNDGGFEYTPYESTGEI